MQDFNEQLNKIREALGEDVNLIKGKLLPEMDKIRKQYSLIENPLHKKNGKFNEQDIIISQLEDGRIIISFMDKSNSNKFYTDTPRYTWVEVEQWYNNGIEKGKVQTDLLWRMKSLWDRIFKK